MKVEAGQRNAYERALVKMRERLVPLKPELFVRLRKYADRRRTTGTGDRTATLYIMSQDGLSTWAAVPLHGTARR